jgi:serine/threonine protein kinase
VQVSGTSQRTIEFLETLGRGGFGAVYLADVRGENDFVQRLAIKVLNLEMAGNADIVARQRDEARLLAQLNHDHIVKVIELTEIEGRPAVLMEYIEGSDAGQILKASLFPPRAALEVGGAIASALHTAYNAVSPVTKRPLRVVHRDIKPANVVVTANGGVKVLDFGVARAEFDREALTRSVTFGTARYMAPESFMLNDIGPAVDIYALGISMIEMLSGQKIGRCPLSPGPFATHIDALVLAVDQPEWGARWKGNLHELLHGLLTWEAGDRPTAKECSDEMLDLSERTSGESLRRFAPRCVPALIEARRTKYAAQDASGFRGLGDTPTESTGTSPSMFTGSKMVGEQEADRGHAEGAGTVSVKLASGFGMASMLLLGLVIGGAAIFISQQGSSPSTVSVDPAVSVTVAGSDAVETAQETERPAQFERRVVDGEPSAVAPAATSSPSRKATAPPRAALASPTPAPAASDGLPAEVLEWAAGADPVVSFGVSFDSEPQGASVYVDGALVGTTPLTTQLAGSRYAVRIVSDSGEASRQIRVAEHAPTRFIWLGGDNWVSGY